MHFWSKYIQLLLIPLNVISIEFKLLLNFAKQREFSKMYSTSAICCFKKGFELEGWVNSVSTSYGTIKGINNMVSRSLRADILQSLSQMKTKYKVQQINYLLFTPLIKYFKNNLFLKL